MKYRSDFVTNSSSSSYIIAIKNDVTEEQLRTVLTKEFVIQELYLDDNDEEAKADQYINDVIDFVIKKKYGYDKPIKLDSWNVFNYIPSDGYGKNDKIFQLLYNIDKEDFIKSKSTVC